MVSGISCFVYKVRGKIMFSRVFVCSQGRGVHDPPDPCPLDRVTLPLTESMGCPIPTPRQDSQGYPWATWPPFPTQGDRTPNRVTLSPSTPQEGQGRQEGLVKGPGNIIRMIHPSPLVHPTRSRMISRSGSGDRGRHTS